MSPSYLETAEGSQFALVFRKLRLPQLVNHSMDMDMLVSGEDNKKAMA